MATLTKTTLTNGAPALAVADIAPGAVASLQSPPPPPSGRIMPGGQVNQSTTANITVAIVNQQAVSAGGHVEVQVAVQASLVDGDGNPVLDAGGNPVVGEIARGAHHTDASTTPDATQMAIDIASQRAVNSLLVSLNAASLQATEFDPLASFAAPADQGASQ